MATNPKPLRKLEKLHFRTRKLIREFKGRKSRNIAAFKYSPLKNYILYKRKPYEVDFLTWGIWFEIMSRNKGRVIKSTQVDKDIRVSTVFIGLDRELFETMIFGGHHNNYQDRHYTYEDALAGHQRACELAFEVPQ